MSPLFLLLFVILATMVINGERMVKVGPHFFTTKNLLTTRAFWESRYIKVDGRQFRVENTLELYYEGRNEPVVLYYNSASELKQAIDDMTSSLKNQQNEKQLVDDVCHEGYHGPFCQFVTY